MIQVAISNRQSRHPVARSRLEAAVRTVLRGEGVRRADVSVAVVDDETIHRLNRRYLEHDYATDVLSFVLEEDGERGLEGEVVVSADTAAEAASRLGVDPRDELLLYVVHGVLHLVGHDDREPDDRRAMRRLERRYLERIRTETRRDGPDRVAGDRSEPDRTARGEATS